MVIQFAEDNGFPSLLEWILFGGRSSMKYEIKIKFNSILSSWLPKDEEIKLFVLGLN